LLGKAGRHAVEWVRGAKPQAVIEGGLPSLWNLPQGSERLLLCFRVSATIPPRDPA